MALGNRRARIWAIGLLPLIVVLVVVTVVWVRGQAGSPAPVSQAEQGPVLLVAGYGGSTGALGVLAAALQAQGRDVEIVPATGDNTGDLPVQAQTLGGVAQRAIEAGAPSVDVVGYSAGGVVARLWAANEGGGSIARRIVTLGSPHHGTDVAGAAAGLLPGACPVACRQLEPDSSVLEGLSEAPAGPRWVSIFTAKDDLVIPATTARLQGALNIELQQVCSDSTVKHGQLPSDPLTISLVELALGGPALNAVPGTSQCDQLRRQD